MLKFEQKTIVSYVGNFYAERIASAKTQGGREPAAGKMCVAQYDYTLQV